MSPSPKSTNTPVVDVIDLSAGRKIHSVKEQTDSSGRIYRRITLFFDEYGSITDGAGYYDPDGKEYERSPYPRRERERRMREDAGIAEIRRETGLDHDSARLLYHHRYSHFPHNPLSAREIELAEQLETRLAAERADRVMNRGNIDWSLHDRHRERAGAQGTSAETGATSAPAQPNDRPLRYVDLALELTPRQWLVYDRIPMRNVSMLGGEGAIGKSLLLMQLSGAVVLGSHWIGTMPEMGSVLYMSCEEDDDEVRRRMEDVARHLGSTRQEMIDCGLRFLSFAGEDAVLAQPDRAGIMRPTPLFERLRHDALEQRPKLIVLDTVADIFAAKENDRAQARQFITMLRGLAMEAEAAVIIAAHPSLEGIRSDTGLSGTTGWHNSVRARMYFKTAPGDDPALRVLECRKNQYGPPSESILLRWRDGVYVVEPGKGTLERLAIEAEGDRLFLELLRRFTKQGRTVSDKRSPTYAPKAFAETPEAKEGKITSKMFADAMERLFAAGKIRGVTEGQPSHPRTRLVETDSADSPANTPANCQPTASQRGGGSLPPYPPPVGREADTVGQRVSPRPPEEEGHGNSGLPADAEFVGRAGPGERCWHCGKAGKGVLLIRRQPSEEVSQLHADCAHKAWTMLPGEP